MEWVETIKRIEREIRNDKEEIRKRQENIERLKLELFLYKISEFGPKICKANNQLGDYRFIEQERELKVYSINLYPLYINIKCWYPNWVKKIYGCIRFDFNPLTKSVDNEILIHSLSQSLKITWTQAEKIINKYKLTIPLVHISDYEVHNMQIDFEKGIPIDEEKNENYIQIKYILVWPTSIPLIETDS